MRIAWKFHLAFGIMKSLLTSHLMGCNLYHPQVWFLAIMLQAYTHSKLLQNVLNVFHPIPLKICKFFWRATTKMVPATMGRLTSNPADIAMYFVRPITTNRAKVCVIYSPSYGALNRWVKRVESANKHSDGRKTYPLPCMCRVLLYSVKYHCSGWIICFIP